MEVKQRVDNPKLTERERQCIRGLVFGERQAETAKKLGISARTARFHVDNAKAKFGAKNQVHLVAITLIDGHLEISR